MGISKTSDHIQIKIKMPNPSQEPPASSKAPKEDLKDMDVLCTFKIKIESQNLDHWYIKNQWPYPNQDQDANPQSGTSSVHQSSKWGPKGHGCTLYPQNQDRESKYWTMVYQRPVTISKSLSLKLAIQPRVSHQSYNFSELNTDTTEAYTEIKLLKTKPKPNPNKN